MIGGLQVVSLVLQAFVLLALFTIGGGAAVHLAVYDLNRNELAFFSWIGNALMILRALKWKLLLIVLLVKFEEFLGNLRRCDLGFHIFCFPVLVYRGEVALERFLAVEDGTLLLFRFSVFTWLALFDFVVVILVLVLLRLVFFVFAFFFADRLRSG